MRPRPEGRGEPDRHLTRTARRRPLQCGHDPKAVESSRRRTSPSSAFFGLLQCGHDPKAVENMTQQSDVAVD